MYIYISIPHFGNVSNVFKSFVLKIRNLPIFWTGSDHLVVLQPGWQPALQPGAGGLDFPCNQEMVKDED